MVAKQRPICDVLHHILFSQLQQRNPPAKAIRKYGSQRTQGIGFPPSSLPVTACHISICLQQTCSAGNSTETPSLLPGAGRSSSSSRPKADWGAMSSKELAACFPHMEEPDLLQDYCVQMKPPSSPSSSLSSQFLRVKPTLIPSFLQFFSA